jgi:hypothetical protein
MAEGIITIKEIITEEALKWGEKYADNVQLAIDKNEELKQSASGLFESYSKLAKVSSLGDLAKIQAEASERAENATKQLQERTDKVILLSQSIERQSKGLVKTYSAEDKSREKSRLSEIKLQKARENAFDKYEKDLQKREKAQQKTKLSEAKLNKAREQAFDKFDAKLKKEQLEREKNVRAQADLRERLRIQREKEENEIQAQANKRIALINQQQEAIRKQKEQEAKIEKPGELDLARNRQKKALIRTINDEALATTGTNKAIIESRVRRAEETRAVKKNLTAMGQLEQKRYLALQNVQNLNAKRALGINISNEEQKELRESTAEFKKYNEAFKKIKRDTGQFGDNVGNYPKGFKLIGTSLKKILPGIGILAGLKFGTKFLLEARDVALQARGIEFAFKRIGEEGESAFEGIKESTRGLLSDLDIKKAIVEFDNFNLDVGQASTLLEFVAVRATQTGKSFDNLRDSLVEGLSKESKLRIDNLGISTKELNDELDKTPSFIQAVSNIAEREIAQAGSILDDAGNSQEKWNASLENFQIAVGNGFIAKASDQLYAMGTNILRAITPTIRLSDAVREEQFELNVLVQKITDVNASQKERKKAIGLLQAQYPGFLKNIDAENVSNKELTDRLKDVNRGYILKIALQDLSQDVDDKATESSDKLRIAFDKEEKARKLLNEAVGFSEANRLLENRSLAEAIELAIKNEDITEESIKAQRKGVNILNEKQKALISARIQLNDANIFEGKSNKLKGEANDLQDRLNRFMERYSDIIEDVDQLKIVGGEEKVNEARARSIQVLNELIAKEQEKLKGATNRGEAKAIQENIKALQKELNAILGNAKASKDRSKEAEKLARQLREDEFALATQRLEQNIENEKRTIESERRSTGDRLLATKNFYDESYALLQLNKGKAEAEAVGRADELLRIQEEYDSNLLALIRTREGQVKQILNDGFESAKARIEAKKQLSEKSANDQIAVLKKQLDEDLDNTELSAEEKQKKVDQYEVAIQKIRRESLAIQIQDQIDAIQLELKSALLSYEYRKALEEQLVALKMALSNQETDNKISDLEEQRKKEEELYDWRAEKIQESSSRIAEALDLDAGNLENLLTGIVEGFDSALEGVEASIMVVGDIFNSVFSANIDKIDEQIEASDSYYDNQIEQAEGDKVRQEALEKEKEAKRKQLDKKKRKEQEKQAKFNKALAVTEIAISTAKAIMGIWAQVPKFDFGVSAGLMTGFVSALGAIQIGAVLSKPIPKYQVGTEFHLGGPAEVGEIRPEVVIEPGKAPYIVDKPSVLDLPRGTKVKRSAEDYMAKLQRASILASFDSDRRKLNNYDTKVNFDQHHREMIGEMKANTKAVKESKSSFKIMQENAPDYDFIAHKFNQFNW